MDYGSGQSFRTAAGRVGRMAHRRGDMGRGGDASEVPWTFLYDEPETVPGYYRKSKENNMSYTFTGRDKKQYWRVYGRMEEEELAGWYPCSSTGKVESDAELILADDEYKSLAPYIYRHLRPGKRSFGNWRTDLARILWQAELRRKVWVKIRTAAVMMYG
ncbi:hypothetical protein [Clostridium sp. AM58-1XD]|uniref:hypothetical protein n=1 Tax=Clostridium sp. AM58-1XD TaxID=2292307 RepID=UPI0015F4A4BD|nr:hypothetical protein [Clostridium sp. AM58-1XD]